MVFRSRTSPVTFTLYPMVHVGEEKFYKATYDEAFNHDVALVEGVRSPVSRHLTRSYRWIDLAKLGLALQPRAPSPDSVAARVVLADLSTDEFHEQWRKVPLSVRAGLFVLAPLVGLRRKWFASRESLARMMSLDDHRSAREILSWEPKFEALHHSLLHARDKRLVECMAAEIDQATGTEKRIAVVYGALHMRAVLKELTRRGFYTTEASWRTIFSF